MSSSGSGQAPAQALAQALSGCVWLFGIMLKNSSFQPVGEMVSSHEATADVKYLLQAIKDASKILNMSWLMELRPSARQCRRCFQLQFV